MMDKHVKDLAKWLKKRNLVLQACGTIELVSTTKEKDGYALIGSYPVTCFPQPALKTLFKNS